MKFWSLAFLLLSSGAQATLIGVDNSNSATTPVSGPVTTSSLTVNGVSQLNGNITLGSGVNVAGPLSVASITVNGVSRLNGNLTMGSGVNVAGPLSVASITVNGTSQFNGNITMGAGTNIAGALTASSITVNGVSRINDTLTITSTTILGQVTGALRIDETGGTCDPDVLANTMGICNIDDQGGAGNVGMGIYIQQAGAGDNYGISVDANGGFYELHGNFTGAGTMSPIRQYTSDDSHTLGGRGTGGGGAAGTTPAFAFNGSSGKVGIFESAPNGQFDIAALAARRPTDPLVQVSSQNATGVFTINVNGDTDQAGSATIRSSATITGALNVAGNALISSVTLSGAAAATPTANSLYKENIVKAWINFNQATDAVADSFNITITDGAAGQDVLDFGIDFANTGYACIANQTCQEMGNCVVANTSAGTATVSCYNATPALADCSFVTVICIGDQ